MTKFCKSFAKLIVVLVCQAASFTGCSLIDEDMRDCGQEYSMGYEMRLVTNITTELSTALSLTSDLAIKGSIETDLEDIFTDFAQDVNISFYDVKGDSLRLQHESHIMNASETSYALHLPARDYMHISAANIAGNSSVTIVDDERCHTARLSQEKRDTVRSHETGIFTARLPMDVREGIDQNFNVHLYMANCASAFVVDTAGVGLKDMKVYVTGFATDFMLCDSVYVFGPSPMVETNPVAAEEREGKLAFVAVNFPSRDPENEPGSRMTIETEDPFISEISDDTIWELHVMATLSDGSVTRSVLGVRRPLRAGQFMVIRASAHHDGSVEPTSPAIAGVSVTLDWNSGGNHEIGL